MNLLHDNGLIGNKKRTQTAEEKKAKDEEQEVDDPNHHLTRKLATKLETQNRVYITF